MTRNIFTRTLPVILSPLIETEGQRAAMVRALDEIRLGDVLLFAAVIVCPLGFLGVVL